MKILCDASSFLPPVFGQPVGDAAGTFVNLLRGGFTLNETYSKKLVTLVARFPQSFEVLANPDVSCKLKHASKRMKLVNKAGEVSLAN